MANNESKVSKTNTLEQWRQKTNEVSHHIGDVDQLDARLTDKVYTYSSTSESVFTVFNNDAASKNLRFELKPEESLDSIATIIMTSAPTIPASFVSSVVLFQGSSGSETFTGTINFINVNKISLKNTTGTFNAALPIKFSSDSIPASKLVRLVSESYKVGYVKASQDSVIAYQELRQDGFHIPNLSLRVVLTGSPSIPASFTEGATVTQANGFSGVLYKATTSELLFKSHSGTFTTAAFAGIPHTDNSNRLAAGNLSSQVTVDNTIGNIIEFHTLPTSDDVVITATNAIDAIIEIQDDVGEIASLGTTDKSDVVSSINELETAVRGTTGNYTLNTTSNDLVGASNEHETDIGNMTLTGLSATDISAALRELRTELGNHASLGTTYTTDAVGAINELETAVRGTTANYTIGTNANDLVGAINEIETVLRQGNANYTLTTNAQNVRDAINEHEADIGSMIFTGLAASNISAAIRELRTELGDHNTINNAAGYSATSASAGIVELQGDVGNISNLTTTATKVVLAINELDLKQGASTLTTSASTLSGAILELEADLFNAEGGTKRTLASLGTTDKTSIVDSINELETAVRGSTANYTLGTSSNNLIGAVNELHGEINSNDTDIAARLIKVSGSSQTLETDLTLGGNKTYTVQSGSTLDVSNGTLLLPGNASGVNTFSVSFLNVDGNQSSTGMGMRIDRAHIGSSPTPYPAIQWRESQVGASKGHRGWQIVGTNAAGSSSVTSDLVTFFNAEELFTNNVETGLLFEWDSTNQNFDVTLDNSTFALTGDVTGSVTQTAKGNVSIATTIAANSVALGTDTTGNYMSGISGTSNEITVTHTPGEGSSATISLPDDVTIGSDLIVTDTLSVLGNTTLGNGAGDTVSIPGSLTITGNLTVNGTQTSLNVATLEVEDTLILAGSSLGSTEPATGGFGFETLPFAGVHTTAAAGVTGAHSIVYNFATDRWEADGSLILSSATLGSPKIENNNYEANDNLNFIQGSGMSLTTAKSGTSHNITYANNDKGSSQAIFKNVSGDSGTNAVADSNNDTLQILGGTALESAGDSGNDRITINHSNVGAGAASYGQTGAENGTYLKSITVNAQGHVTAVTSDNFNDVYVREDETSTVNTANFVVRRDAARNINATTFTGALSGNVTGNVTGNVSGSSGSTTGDAASASTVYVTEANEDATFRRLVWHTGDGSGNKSLHHDDSLTYRASTNTLSVANLSGNASTATTASNSTKVFVNEYNSTTTMRVLGSHDGINSQGNVYSNAGIYMNMSSDTVFATTFSGALSGHATTAGTITSQANSATITASDAAGNSTIVRRTGSGYIFANYLNTTANDVTSGVTKIMVETGNDNYIRHGDAASVRAFLGVASGATNSVGNATHTGDATGSVALTIAANVVSNTKLADMGANTIKGRITSAGDPQDLSAANVRTILNVANGANAYSFPYTITAGNTANTVVFRNASGDFNAGTITASLSGHATSATSATYASKVSFNTQGNSNTNLKLLLGDPSNSAITQGTIYKDGSLSYNTSSNTLYAGVFNGAFTGTLTGNASSASVSSTVAISYNNNSNSTYQMLWGSGNSVYGTSGIYCNPFTDTIYATGDIIAAASDDSLKDKKGNIENALEKVNALNGFHYNWNDKAVELGFKTEEQKEEEHIGLSAQDIKAVAPELVTESSVEGYDTVRYDKVTALLVEAVKELTEQNKELKAEIESLKSINS